MRRTCLTLVVVLAAVGIIQVGPTVSPAWASTFAVTTTTDGVDAVLGDGQCRTSDGTCTLRAAVQEANARVGADVIQLAATTYTLSIGDSCLRCAQAGRSVPSNSGDLDVTGDLTILGASTGTTTVAGVTPMLDRVLHVHEGATATVRNVRVTGGVLLDQRYGGGIWNEGTLTFEGGAVTGNSTGGFIEGGLGGGGIANEGTLVLDRTSIYNNDATISGGGLLNTGTATISNTTFALNRTWVHNQCWDRSAGGGVLNYGTLTLTRSRLTQNEAPFLGGGLYNTGSARLDQTTVDGNLATQGAGIFNIAPGDLQMVNATVSGNRARTVQYHGSECYYESSTAQGGGLLSTGTARLYNLTVAFNESPSGGQNLQSWHRTLGTGQMMVVSTIVGPPATRSCSRDPRYMPDQLVPGGGNIDSGDQCGFWDGGGRSNTDARLRPLGSNGGPAPTHALGTGSPAIDFGATWTCPSTDGRGYVRPVDGNGDGVARCDSGAYEAGSLPPSIALPPITRPPIRLL
jgi:CSLREA domain-containing protein